MMMLPLFAATVGKGEASADPLLKRAKFGAENVEAGRMEAPTSPPIGHKGSCRLRLEPHWEPDFGPLSYLDENP